MSDGGSSPSAETVDEPEARDAGIASAWVRRAGRTDEGEELAKRLAFEAARVRLSPAGDDGRSSPRFGHYFVLEKLGAGAMGVVYAAYDPDLDRKVALKVLKSSAGDSTAKRRLQREARALARLNHANVVTVHGVGDHEGQPWVAMEFVEGQDLHAWLRAEARPWSVVLDAFLAAGRGLAAAHAAGVVHRDFKPANVLIGVDGIVRVADFGLARPASEVLPSVSSSLATTESSGPSDSWKDSDDGLTRTRGVVGTPAYMAPEQYLGSDVGPAADQYAFCVSLFEGLYGVVPFAGESLLALVEAKSSATFVDRPSDTLVPRWLHDIVVRGLAPKPESRFSDLDALIDAVEVGLRGAERRPRWPLWLVGGAAAAGLGAVAASNWPAPEAADPCATVAAPMAEIWDQRRGAIEDAILATELPYASEAWRRASTRLDTHAQAWTSARAQVCRDLNAGAMPEEAASRRRECLERAKTSTRTVTDLLARADAEVLAHADELLGQLDEPTVCLGPEILTSQLIRARDPKVRARGDAVMDEIGEVYALNIVNKPQEAAERVESIRSALPELEPFVRGEASRVLATALPPHDPERLRLLRQGLADGLRAREDRLTALCAFDVGTTQAALGKFEAAHEHLELALALMDRIVIIEERTESDVGFDAVVRPKVLASMGQTHLQQGHTDLGLDFLRQATDAVEPLEARWAFVRVEVYNAYAEGLRESGRLEDALEWYAQALEVGAADLGSRHPHVGNVLNNRGAAYVDLGRFEEGRADLERGREIVVAQQGEDAVGLHDYNLGLVALGLGELEIAEERLQHARARFEKQFPPRHPFIAFARMSLGTLARHRGQVEQARVHSKAARESMIATFGDNPSHMAATTDAEHVLNLVAAGELEGARALADRAVAGFEQSVGTKTPAASVAFLARGELALAEGRLADAAPDLDRAIEILETHGSPTHPELVWPLLARAKLHAQQRDQDAAQRDVDRAAEIRPRSGPSGAHCKALERRFAELPRPRSGP